MSINMRLSANNFTQPRNTEIFVLGIEGLFRLQGRTVRQVVVRWIKQVLEIVEPVPEMRRERSDGQSQPLDGGRLEGIRNCTEACKIP